MNDHDADDRALLAELRLAMDDTEADVADDAVDVDVSAELAGYRIVGRLGQGGMGVVYEAEQRSPRRRVALKVARPGLVSERSLRRFELEAELLGRLDHPGIARIHEAGTYATARGAQPFYAMELVRGRPLMTAVAAQGLDVRARLALFATIADAVHHAHGKGVLHRDLKPANILVDQEGRPKVLDFGIARALDEDARAASLVTLPGQPMGTLPYMSPEQVAGRWDDVDVRSDVYSLGVILYELLAGCLPHDPTGKSVGALVREIEEVEPLRLGAQRPALCGDLEAIAAKALDKDSARRYDSAAAFAADVRRYLADESVEARLPTVTEQWRRFGRRHRGLVAGVAAIVISLVIGMLATLGQAARAREAEGLAREREQAALDEARRAQVASGFLRTVLLQASPVQSPGAQPTLRDMLDRAAWLVGSELANEPTVEIEIQQSLGRAYGELGDRALAREHLERALELAVSVHGEDSPAAGFVHGELAGLALDESDWETAEQQARRALTLLEDVEGPARRSVAAALSTLGMSYYPRLRNAEAERHLQRSIGLFAQLGGPSRADVGVAIGNLALIHTARGDLDAAAAGHREAIEILTTERGPDHPIVASNLTKLAHVLRLAGDLEEAKTAARAGLELQRRRLGDDHPDLATNLEELARTELAQGGVDAAADILREALAIDARFAPAEDPFRLQRRTLLAQILVQQRRAAEAEQELRDVVALASVERAGDMRFVALEELAILMALTDRGEEAAARWDQALELGLRIYPAAHVRILKLRENYGAFLLEQGRLDAVERILRGGYLAVDAADGATDALRDTWRDRLEAIEQARAAVATR